MVNYRPQKFLGLVAPTQYGRVTGLSPAFRVRVWLRETTRNETNFEQPVSQQILDVYVYGQMGRKKVILYTMSTFTTHAVIFLLANDQCHVPGHVDWLCAAGLALLWILYLYEGKREGKMFNIQFRLTSNSGCACSSPVSARYLCSRILSL